MPHRSRTGIPESMPDKDRILELERRDRELEMEVAFLKKASAKGLKPGEELPDGALLISHVRDLAALLEAM